MKKFTIVTLILIAIMSLFYNACNAQIKTISHDSTFYVNFQQIGLKIGIKGEEFVPATFSHRVAYELVVTNLLTGEEKIWDLASHNTFKNISLPKGSWTIHLNLVVCNYERNICEVINRFRSNTLGFTY